MQNKPKHGDVIVVWFSCGAASAVAARETIRRYGDICDVRLVNNPVIEEDDDNRRFMADVSHWLGYNVVEHRNPSFPSASAVDVWNSRRAMSFPKGAPCTIELKKAARQNYENQHKIDWHVFGFTVDEKMRHDRFVLTERSNVLPVLIEANISKAKCLEIIASNGISLPAIYSHGFPNANCVGCVKATSPTYWNLTRKVYPEIYAQRSEQSRRLGVKLVRYKGTRIFLDELPLDAVGRPLRKHSVECGIVCEEKFNIKTKTKTKTIFEKWIISNLRSNRSGLFG